MADEIPEDMTEIYDADVPRVDLVGKAANGIPRFLIAKGEAGPGLFDPAYVRDLIAKSEPADQALRAGETVTMSGSPAAIAALIHGAPVRKADPTEPSGEQIAKAKYNADDLRRLAANGQAMKDESYPIADKEDLGRAIRAVGRGGASHDAIRAHIIRRAKALGASSEIPDTWGADGSLKKADADTAPAPDTSEVAKDMDGSAGMPTDDGIDGMDPTVVLAAPDEDAPGDPNDPGSPAWEAIDAATACKWTAILARARTALGVMADRELLEAATADPSDAESAMDLSDAACAIDYAISILAPFAVDEQAESDEGAMALEMVGKAMAGFDPAALDTVESLGAVRKAGRVLSSANESAIRGAVESLQKVLASLPAAPTTDDEGGRAVAKTANEEPDMATPTPAEDVTAASGQQPALGAAESAPKPAAGAVVTDVAKADDTGKPDMVAVYDQDGNLVGVVAPTDITRIATAKAPTGNTADDTAPTDGGDGAQDAPPADMTPAPAASVGTPADAVPADDDSVAKAADTTENNEAQDVLKGSIQELVKAAIDEHSAPQGELIKSLEDRNRVLEERNEALAKQAESLEERLTKVENQPAVMAIASNGAIPPAHLMRGQDRGAPADMTQGQILKARLAASDDAIEKKRIADEMQGLAIAEFQKLQQGARAR